MINDAFARATLITGSFLYVRVLRSSHAIHGSCAFIPSTSNGYNPGDVLNSAELHLLSGPVSFLRKKCRCSSSGAPNWFLCATFNMWRASHSKCRIWQRAPEQNRTKMNNQVGLHQHHHHNNTGSISSLFTSHWPSSCALTSQFKAFIRVFLSVGPVFSDHFLLLPLLHK